MSQNWIEKKECATKEKEFMWAAEYRDGTVIYEHEDEKTFFNFNQLEKDKVGKFHLLGRGFIATLNTDTGRFSFPNIDVGFSIDNIDITNIEGQTYNDIIQYKGFYTDGIENNSKAASGSALKIHTSSYHMGWKKTITLEDGRVINAKIIFNIRMGVGAFLSVHLASEDIKGKANFIVHIGNRRVVHPINFDKTSVDFDIKISE